MIREKARALLGYNVFFWLCFWAFFYWTFPYDRLAIYLTQKVAESGSGYHVEIGHLAPHWLTGVALEDVKIRKLTAPTPTTPSTDAAEGAIKDDAIAIKEVHARVGLLSLITGATDISFNAELDKGNLEGEYFANEDETRIDATLNKLDIGRLGLLDSLISLPAVGTLQGEFDLVLAKDPTKSNGSVKMTIKDFTLGDGQAKVKLGSMGGLTVDPVNAGDVTLELDVTAGVGQVKRLSASGADVELQGTGEVRFAQPLSRSRIDITLQIKFTDVYRNKSARTKAMFSLLDNASAPQVKSAMTSDGGLAYRLLGALSGLRAIPAGKSNDRKATSQRALPAQNDDDDDAE